MSNRLSRFWRELKRRNVLKVVAMYAGAAYVLIELANNVADPLHLPEWTARLIILLALVGFPVVTILSWIFDLTPGGIKRTATADVLSDEKQPDQKPRRKLKVSDVIIAILFAAICILVYPKIFSRDKLKDIRDQEGKISVAVMPFRNLSPDSTLDIWQQGLQNLLITSLTNSEGLSLRQAQAINDIIGSEDQVSYASLNPSLARDAAARLKANTVILGNLFKSGNQFRLTANLMNVQTEELYRSFEANGRSEDDFFCVVDSLSGQIRDFLEIEFLEKGLPMELKDAYTSSAEAYKYYLQGRNYHGKLDYPSANELYNEALKIDSNFVLPMLYLTYSLGDMNLYKESKRWAYKAYEHLKSVPVEIQLQIKQVKAMVDKRPYEQIRYITEYLDANPYSTQQFYSLGWVCFNTHQWEKAIDAFEHGIQLNEQLGGRLKLWVYYYTLLGNSYCKTGNYAKAAKAYEDGLQIWQDDPQIIYWQAVCAITRGDSLAAEGYLQSLSSLADRNSWSATDKLLWIASCYEQGGRISKAKELYLDAFRLYPDHIGIRSRLAYFFLTHDIDIDRGMELILPLLKENPDNFEYLYSYGRGLYKKGDFDLAMKVLNQSWDLRPRYLHEHYLLLQEITNIKENI